MAEGEIVNLDNYTPVGADVEVLPLAPETMVLDQTGAPWSVFAVQSSGTVPRMLSAP